jgi:hypothetical protein
MTKYPYFTRSTLARFRDLPVTPDLDLREIVEMGDGNYHVRDHIEADSEQSILERWSGS